MFSGRLAVAGQNHGAQALSAEFCQYSAGLSANIITQNDSAEQVALGEPDFRKAGLSGRNLSDGAAMPGLPLSEPVAPAQEAFRVIITSA